MVTSFLLLLLLLVAPLPPHELELKRLVQLDSIGARFDLSGIVKVGERIFVVSDKEWDRYIYEIRMSENKFTVIDQFALGQEGFGTDLDLEGIGYCDGDYYLVNESGNNVIITSLVDSVRILAIDYKQTHEDPSNWGKNTGYEGVGLDCQNMMMYLAKEREPRFLVTVDLKTGKAIGKFNPATGNEDVSDLYFENGFLYVLERNAFLVTKLDALNMEIVDRVSYGEICNSPDGKLFEPAQYGMAEALLLTNQEIWIGLDNNSVQVSDHARKMYHISGSNPVILVFTRPQGF